MKTIAVMNQKGGSAKTTTAVNLAAGLAERGRRVLLVDLDAQASASSWLGVEDGGRGMYDVFTGGARLADQARPTGVEGVDLAPSSAWMVGVEKALAAAEDAERRLRRNLEDLPTGRWDYVLLDCPPALGVVTVNALAAAAEVLIPVEAHVLPLKGLVQLLSTLEVVRERLNADLGIFGILVCRLDSRTRHSREVLEILRERFGSQVFETVIRENVRLAECPSFGQPITLYAPRSTGALDYRALAGEILGTKRTA